MNWMILPLRRYAQFTGRSRRLEYWAFALFYAMALIAAAAIDLGLGHGSAGRFAGAGTYSAYASIWGPVSLVAMLAMIVPQLAVTVRRLHDIDRSGWWLMIGLVPLIGGIVLFVFTLLDGTPGPNGFGGDPKQRAPYR